MDEPLIPDEVQAFLLEHIDSIAELEALMLLRADPARAWSAEAIAKRLYISTREAAMALDRLAADRLLSATIDGVSGGYRYLAKSSELSRLVDRVADAYAKCLIPVTNLIHARPRSRVQEFADAFKLRKKEP